MSTSSPLMDVTESFRRCLESPDFFACFYELLLSRAPELKSLDRSRDRESREVMLRKGITAMILHAAGVRSATDSLTLISASDSNGWMPLPPQRHAVWIDTLIDTVRAFDPRFDTRLDSAWKDVLRRGVSQIDPDAGNGYGHHGKPLSTPAS